MKEYAFDCKLQCAIRVNAASEEEAREMLAKQIDGASANLGAWPNGDPILAETSLDDTSPTLFEVDGEAV